MKSLTPIAQVLVLVGALNWGLVGLLGVNLVSELFGSVAMLEKLVYIFVGLSGLWLVYVMYGMGGKKKK